MVEGKLSNNFVFVSRFPTCSSSCFVNILCIDSIAAGADFHMLRRVVMWVAERNIGHPLVADFCIHTVIDPVA